jgi:Lar family restriction alleviation protein
MTPQLKPCPFCGGEAKMDILGGKGSTHRIISCARCKCDLHYQPTEELAVSKWNQRVEPTPPPARELAPWHPAIWQSRPDFLAWRECVDGIEILTYNYALGDSTYVTRGTALDHIPASAQQKLVEKTLDEMTAVAQFCLDEMARHDGCVRMREALSRIRSGVKLMVPEPQQSAFIEIIDTALSAPQEQKHD